MRVAEERGLCRNPEIQAQRIEQVDLVGAARLSLFVPSINLKKRISD